MHPDLACLDLAERRKAFPRALRVPGPLGSRQVRQYLERSCAEPTGSPSRDLVGGAAPGGREIR
ncbi:Putative nucleic-acid-binding protein implicated in transcription termination (fragment) [Frankia canadensis]|uniref:Nucleic-acid-binding protein implicated in transcription termination n=1 Tax=Frankia canadensis TaxID=1836972 RepID=A0A2I2L234_9ACTN